MSTSRAENPVPGVVTFTARGDSALDRLADALVAECDGSPGGIADILERVLDADVEDLAECLSETTEPHADRPGRGVDEVDSAGESLDNDVAKAFGKRRQDKNRCVSHVGERVGGISEKMNIGSNAE